MAVVTLLQFRTQARQRADQLTSNFITDAELTGYVNSSLAELYGLLVQKFEDYYTNTATFLIASVANQDTYVLPGDFFKLQYMDISTDASLLRWATVRPYNNEQRNKYNYAPNTWINGPWVTNVRYRIFGNSVKFIPLPALGGQTIRVTYIPQCPILQFDSDTFNGVNGWEEFVVIDAAMKMKIKEESPIQDLMATKQMIVERIESEAAERDANRSVSTQDVTDAIGMNWGVEGWW